MVAGAEVKLAACAVDVTSHTTMQGACRKEKNTPLALLWTSSIQLCTCSHGSGRGPSLLAICLLVSSRYLQQGKRGEGDGAGGQWLWFFVAGEEEEEGEKRAKSISARRKPGKASLFLSQHNLPADWISSSLPRIVRKERPGVHVLHRATTEVLGFEISVLAKARGVVQLVGFPSP